MAVDIQIIEKGTTNWHIPLNANLENIKAAFEQLDAQAGQADVRTTIAAFYALSSEQLAEMYASGTRRIHVQSYAAATGKKVPTEMFLLSADGSYYPISSIKPEPYAYEGRDLSTIFASAQELRNAVAAGDFSRIHIGDYWPVTLNGNYTDCGENTTKTLSNAAVKLEVAGINTYMQYGDTPVSVPHLVMCSRDCLPNTTKWRSANTTWYKADETNPWRGSAVFSTLNVGILPLLAATDIGAFIHGGPNGNGMRFLGEVKASDATAATSWEWFDRGKLFLPHEREVWGQSVWSEQRDAGLAQQWPIFAGSLRHVIKGLGDGGSRYAWWLGSSNAGDASTACHVNGYGHANAWTAGDLLAVPLCFLLA